MADNLSSDQRQLLEAACKIADRFNEYQVDEESLVNRLGWDSSEFSRIRDELEDAGYITRKGAPRSVIGGSGSSRRALICVRSREEAGTPFS